VKELGKKKAMGTGKDGRWNDVDTGQNKWETWNV